MTANFINIPGHFLYRLLTPLSEGCVTCDWRKITQTQELFFGSSACLAYIELLSVDQTLRSYRPRRSTLKLLSRQLGWCEYLSHSGSYYFPLLGCVGFEFHSWITRATDLKKDMDCCGRIPCRSGPWSQWMVHFTHYVFCFSLCLSTCPAPSSVSPSRGGDVTVYVSDINQPSLPTLFILLLSLFLSSWPFRLYFVP